jgi:PAS domain-containing protein
MNLSFFAKLLGLFLLGLVVVFVIDPLDKTTVCTPFLLGITLMALSLRRSTELVVGTALIYAVLTAYALVTHIEYVQNYMHPVSHPYFTIFLRMGLFLVVCAMAIYLAHYRTNTNRILVHIQDILAKLPAPVVISDATGYITYANDALGAIFKKEASQLTGKRYVDFMMSDIQEGKAMRYYIEVFGDDTNGVHELEVTPLDSRKMKARLTCLGSGPSRVLITAFDVLQIPTRVGSFVPPEPSPVNR